LSAFGLWRGSSVAQFSPSSSTQVQDPREGPSLAGRTVQGLTRSGLTRQAREEAERSRRRLPREVHMMQAMMIEGQAGAGQRNVLISPLVLRGQAQARSTKASSKGFPIGATRPRPGGQQDGGHRGAQDSVIASAFDSRRPPLVKIACTRCPPSNPAIVESLPAQYFGRGPRPL